MGSLWQALIMAAIFASMPREFVGKERHQNSILSPRANNARRAADRDKSVL